MALVFQTNKRTGITYAYESASFWDKEKKQSRSIRKLIGKVDPDTGEIVPTRSYTRRGTADIALGPSTTAPAHMRRGLYGTGYLLDQIGHKLGITQNLKECFPSSYRQVLSLAYYMLLEQHSDLSKFNHWQRLHYHPYGKNINLSTMNDLFQVLDDAGRKKYFKRLHAITPDKDFWVLDNNYMHSFSETLTHVNKGRNQELGRVPQIHMLYVYGAHTYTPYYYEALPGKIIDAKVMIARLEALMATTKHRPNVMLSRGFYSKCNMDWLMAARQPFMIGVNVTLKYVNAVLDAERDTIKQWKNLQTSYGVYAVTREIDWNYTHDMTEVQEVSASTQPAPVPGKAYVTIVYDPKRVVKDQSAMNDYLNQLYSDLQEDTLRKYRQKDYEKYFTKTTSASGEITIVPNESAVHLMARNNGFEAVLSNIPLDIPSILGMHRNKETIERGFGNLKDRLSYPNHPVTSELVRSGKIFIGFIVQQYLSYLTHKVSTEPDLQAWTVDSLLQELDTIEMFESPAHGRQLGLVTAEQEGLYRALDVPIPSVR